MLMAITGSKVSLSCQRQGACIKPQRCAPFPAAMTSQRHFDPELEYAEVSVLLRLPQGDLLKLEKLREAWGLETRSAVIQRLVVEVLS